MPNALIPIILAGGSGERFWPLSTPERPKQFLDLDQSGRSLLRRTADRLLQLAPEKLYVQTSTALADATREELNALPAEILAEPERRDTAPAMAWALAHLLKHGDDAVLGFFPADHWIQEDDRFAATVFRAAALAAEQDAIVVIGVQPTRPATEYGYIQRGARLPEHDDAWQVQRFTEKPDSVQAATFLETGQYDWNAGMFIVRAGVLRDAFERHTPNIWTPLATSPDEATYASLPRISFDYAIMEKTSAVVSVRADFHWDDLGDWNALARLKGDGVIGPGVVLRVDSGDNVIFTDNPDETVALIGVRDCVIVRSGHRTLIVPRRRTGEIKALLSRLES